MKTARFLGVPYGFIRHIIWQGNESVLKKVGTVFAVTMYAKLWGIVNMILFLVLLYEVVSVVGVGLFLRIKTKNHEEGFVNANRSLSTPIIGVTLALTFLGSLHVFGVMELSWDIGMAAMWVSVAHVTLLCIICLCTGRWVRRLNIGTVPELLEKLFGHRVRVATSCVNAACVFGLLSMEAQAIGIVLSGLTGISIQAGAAIGGVIGILYVFLAGMREIGLVNVVNTIVMFSGLIVTGLVLGGFLPSGWDGVENYFISNNMADKLTLFGSPGVIIGFGIPTVIACIFAQGISQMGLQVAMSAKSERTIFKSIFLAGILNGCFTIFTVIIGIAAQAIPDVAALGPKLSGPGLIVKYLPPWLVIWLCASFLGALLSTFATNVLAPATLFVKDIYISCSKRRESEAQQAKKIKLMIIILGIVAVCVSFFLPAIVEGANWMFSWLCPMFWITVFGLFWKRSKTAGEITLFGTWVVNFLWTFTPLKSALGMAGVMNAYVTLVLSLALGIITFAALPGEPGLFRLPKEQWDTAAVR
jgi:SSS family solute:Na+ symporter